MLQQLKATLKTTQQRMAESTNKSRLDYNFRENDWVLLRRQAYCQTSLSSKTHNKLGQRFFGLYPIKCRINEVAYELFLPSSSCIHPVFHISFLKPYHGPTPPLHFKFPLEPENPPVPTHDLPTLFPNYTSHSETSNIPLNSLKINPTKSPIKFALANTWQPSTVHAPLKLSPPSFARDPTLPKAQPTVTHAPKPLLSMSHPTAASRDTPISNATPAVNHSPHHALSNSQPIVSHTHNSSADPTVLDSHGTKPTTPKPNVSTSFQPKKVISTNTTDPSPNQQIVTHPTHYTTQPHSLSRSKRSHPLRQFQVSTLRTRFSQRKRQLIDSLDPLEAE